MRNKKNEKSAVKIFLIIILLLIQISEDEKSFIDQQKENFLFRLEWTD